MAKVFYDELDALDIIAMDVFITLIGKREGPMNPAVSARLGYEAAEAFLQERERRQEQEDEDGD